MSSRPDSPSPEKWLEYQRGTLSESESRLIEAYVEAHGVPPELAALRPDSADDSLVNQLRQLGAGPLDNTIRLNVLHAAENVKATPGEVDQLMKLFPDLGENFISDASIDVSEIGHYQIIANVSRSRMGRVYRGVDKRTGAAVALKFPPEVLSQRTLERFHREIAVTRRLKHPRIVTMVDELQFRSLPVYVMPWVEGIDLGRVVRAKRRLTEAETASIGVAVVETLKYLAEKGVVHRDIKPSNLMLTPSGELVLIDLGLALLNNSEITDGTYTESVQIIGTMDYIAPEQARDAHSADFRADIYSLGCTLCKLATGLAPFEQSGGRHALQKIMAHSLDPFPDLYEKYNDISIEFVDLLKRMCTKQAGERLTDHDQIIESLKKLADGADLKQLYLNSFDSIRSIKHESGLVPDKHQIKTPLLKFSRRNAIAAGLVGVAALGVSQRARIKTGWERLGGLFQRPTDFLFAEKPKKWLDPHSVFVMDGNIRTIHVIAPDTNYQVSGFTPPYSGSNLAITRSGLMFGATSQGRIRKVDLKTNIGRDYPNLVLDQDLNDSRGNGSGGMVYVNAKSLYVTGKISGRLYKIDTTMMEFDKSFGEGGFVKVGEIAFGVDHDPEGNLYVACHTGVTKVSSDGKKIQKDFISGLTRATAVSGFTNIFVDDIFVADGNRILRFSKEGKLINSRYLLWEYEVDHFLIDRDLNLFYLSNYGYVDRVDIYKTGVQGIPYRQISKVGLNLAQMTIPVPD